MERRKLTKAEEQILFDRAVDKELLDEEAFQTFLRIKSLENVRDTTISKYEQVRHVIRRDLKRFKIDNYMFLLSENDIEKLIIFWKEEVATATINGRLRVLNTYYRVLINKGYIKKSPLQNIKKLKEREQVKPTLTDEEVNKLINVMLKRKTYAGFRDYVVFLLLLNTGLRISETLVIEIEDVEEDRIRIRTTKNGKERTVFPSKNTLKLINKYIKVRGKVDETDILFLSSINMPLKKRTYQESLANAGLNARLKKSVSPHMLRRTYAKNAIKAGMDVFTLAKLLGHSTLMVTKSYAELYGSDLQVQSQKVKEFM